MSKIAKKKKSIYRLAKYRIRFDQYIDGKYIYDKDNKEDAMKLLRDKLERFPYANANLQILNKGKDGYKAHSSYGYRMNKKTRRMRLKKL